MTFNQAEVVGTADIYGSVGGSSSTVNAYVVPAGKYAFVNFLVSSYTGDKQVRIIYQPENQSVAFPIAANEQKDLILTEGDVVQVFTSGSTGSGLVFARALEFNKP